MIRAYHHTGGDILDPDNKPIDREKAIMVMANCQFRIAECAPEEVEREQFYRAVQQSIKSALIAASDWVRAGGGFDD